ncbi:hypothetical protein [Gracilibacillus dipsosauri]|uniref:hypothetical protein n=1 Tax=Gracilibacillus dipsosauri TaxID=178340 RepID=UPI00240A9091
MALDPISYKKAKDVQEQLNQAVAEGDQLAETQQARVDNDGNAHVTLKERIDSDVSKLKAKDAELSSQLAQKANEDDVRKKYVPISLNDIDAELLAAIQNKEGETTFNLLSEPREKSVNLTKTNFLTTENLFIYDKTTFGATLSQSTGNTSTSTEQDASDFIPVKAGLPYSITKGARTIIFYNENKEFSSVIESSSQRGNTYTFVPPDDGYVRIAIFKESTEGFTMVQSDEPNAIGRSLKFSLPLLEAVDNKAIVDKSVDYTKTDFLEVGKNLFDKNTVIKGMLIDTTNGNLTPHSTYDTSDFIKLKANKPYTMNKVREYALYGLDKITFNKAFNTGDNNATVTITPKHDCFMRVSIANYNLDTFQIEEGTEVTEYEPFRMSFPTLNLTDRQKQEVLDLIAPSNNGDIVVIKTGNAFSVSSYLENGDSIKIDTLRNGSKNGAFNFNGTFINGNKVHDTTDDIAPIRTFTTVGGNHGYTCVKITMSNHGKTNSDLGSQWTDGNNVYTLLDINGNDLMFGMQYTEVDGIDSVNPVVPIANLTHASGATNTGVINVSTSVTSPLFPSINNVSVKYVLDGREIKEDGTYYGNELQVQESYNIMDYKGIIDFAQSNIGVSYKNDAVKGVVKISNNYTFTKEGKCLVSGSIKALKKVFLGECGFMQSVALNLSNHTLKRYMPNVLVRDGIDFKNIQDMTNYDATRVFSAPYLEDPNKPPNRYVDWLYNGNDKKYGFSMGLIVDKSNTKNSDRVTNINGYYWNMRNTKKSYPVVIFDITLNEGEYLSFLGYRNYLTPTQATIENIVQDKKDTYIIVDYHNTVIGENINLNDLIGKSVEVIDSENFTLLNDVIDSEGVTFSIKNDYGYAILKVS